MGRLDCPEGEASNTATKFKQAENNASHHVLGKCIYSLCDDSCMGM